MRDCRRKVITKLIIEYAQAGTCYCLPFSFYECEQYRKLLQPGFDDCVLCRMGQKVSLRAKVESNYRERPTNDEIRAALKVLK